MRSARRESYLRLFLRFLRFGVLAWGGPVAQIAMIRQEFVEEERWIDRERFNRVLAVYQVLPGPEATELCVYFGFVSRGRMGGLLAGLAFMLPGFVLMFALSWFYVTIGIGSVVFAAVFRGMQPAVVALIVRAVQRIGQHALTDRWLWMIAVVAGIAEWLGAHFVLTLALAGLAYTLVKRGQRVLVIAGAVVFLLTTFAAALNPAGQGTSAAIVDPVSPLVPSLPALLGSGLRAGLLTFGGAYTSIPFLREDAVEVGRWMTDAQFLDGLALSGILPAPLIIFSTFIGYLGGGPIGALAVTLGVFLPAFGFTLIGYDLVERVVANKALHALLDGVTAGVVGLIAVTAIRLVGVTIVDWPALCIFSIALLVLSRWKANGAVAVVMLGAGALGLLLFH
jgi:chromate transporter